MKTSAKTKVYGEDLAVHLRFCQAGIDVDGDDDDEVDDDKSDDVNEEDNDDIRSHERSIAAPLSLGVKGLKNNLKEEGLFR